MDNTPDLKISDQSNPYGGITRIVASRVYGARFAPGEVLFTIPAVPKNEMLEFAERDQIDAVVVMNDGRELLRLIRRNGDSLRLSTFINFEDRSAPCAELVLKAEEAVRIDEIESLYPITYIQLVHD